MEINVNITRQDYIDFNVFYHFNKRIKEKLLMILGLSIGLPFIMNLIFQEPFYLHDFLYEVLKLAIIFSILLIIFVYISIFVYSKLPSKTGVFLGPKKYTITEEGFIEDSEINHNILKWNGIKSIDQNKNFIYVFIEFNAAQIIPKRYFKDSQEINEFIQNIDNKLS